MEEELWHAQQQGQLWQLLLEFQGSFPMSEEEVGRTHLVQHDTIKCRPHRLPLACQQACEQSVWNMLQADIIDPSNSPWAAAVVMVPRRTVAGGSAQTMVNGVTRVSDLVSGSSWFSSLDLSGYYQVPLSPEARPKTAFCNGRGL